MVPNFALSLSFEGIGLLRHVDGVWARLDETALDVPDLQAAIEALRQGALSLDPDAAQVVLVIPNEQIRYLDQPDTGEDGRDAAIRTALDGTTPYDVRDLVYDHALLDGQMKIAAVAKETLEEAEEFALGHGFEPVSFAAIAPDGAFDGAVHFGKCRSWKGRPRRLPSAMQLVEASEAARQPVPALLPDPEPKLDLVSPVATEQTSTDDIGADTAAPTADAPQVSATAPDPAAEDTAPTPLQKAEAESQDTAEDTASSGVFFSTIRAARPDSDTPDNPDNPAPEAPALNIAPRITPVPPVAETTAPPVTKATGQDAAPADSTTPPAPVQTAAPLPPEPAHDPAPKPVPSPEDAGISAASLTEPQPDTPPPGKGRAMRFLSRRRKQASQAKQPPSVAKPTSAQSTPRIPAAPGAMQLGKPVASAPAPQPTPETTGPSSTKKTDKTPGKSRALAGLSALRAAKSDAARTGDAPDAPNTPDKTRAALGKLSKLRKPGAKEPADKNAALAAALAAPTPQAVPKAPSVTPPAPATDKTVETTPEQDAELQRLTAFGARHNARKVGGKPRFLGLALMAVLLMAMAGVAAWGAAFFGDGGGLLRSDAPAQETTAEAPALPDPATLTDLTAEEAAETEGEAEELRLAALQDEVTPSDPRPAPQPALTLESLTPEQAAATYAATGVWQRAPSAPRTPRADGVEDVYAASIDGLVPKLDAVALPDPRRFERAPDIADPGLPPPAGLRFDFDGRGFIRPSAEGTLSPDGLRIFTGRPPAVPPFRQVPGAEPQGAVNPTPGAVPGQIRPALRPGTLDGAEAAPQVAPSANPLARIRPEARPSDLIEQRERAQLGGISRAELAQFRPVMRPRTEQEEAVAEAPETPATAQAVARSLTPLTRPRNMAAIVRRAETRREEQEAQVVRTAAVAPRTVSPSGPTGGSVARAATVRNAINLSKVSLIGVFGTESNRRALVRLPNGKYKKVKVGDRVDGGRVSAIDKSQLKYTKSGRSVTLKMPRG
ncbi:MAG: hypothetical protein N4A53_12405 [Pelagimonas sp.]|jgi:hypothetical protein|nr:hypothetical protein [Pelagimonas sp.]